MDELRQRLQEAEHSWMECKEDSIRFTGRLNTAEREVIACKRFFFRSFLFFVRPFSFHRALTWHYLSRDLAKWAANIPGPREP